MKIILFIMILFSLPGFSYGDRKNEINVKIDSLMKAVSEESDKYTNMITGNSHPRYCLDGKYAAFTASIGSYTNKIYLMELSNSKYFKVIDNPDIIHKSFVFSKYINRILYLESCYIIGDKDWRIDFKQMDLKTGKINTIYKISNESINLLTYSSDESKIYFVKWDDKGKRIYCIGTNGQNLIRMEDRPYFTIDSIVSLPDNKTIVYSASGDYFDKDNGNGIFMADEDNRKEIIILPGSYFINYRLVFSYNYSNFIYVTQYAGIFKLFLDKNLFPYDTNVQPFVVIPEKYTHFEDLSLSPDGKRILFSHYLKTGIIFTNVMKEVNIDGTGLRGLPVTKEDLMKAEVYKVE